jgi:predicted alpha/beta-hydrolase family hydrolase
LHLNFLLLTHGAGGNRNAPLLVALAKKLAEHDVEVVRYDLPYRQDRPQGPPRPSDSARDREGLREQLQKLRAKQAGPVWLGGHSYGGRQSSMLLAEEPALADRLLLLSYPLHPPGKPERLRTAHLPQLRTPTLFAHGSKDPFGSLDELKAAVTLIPAPVQVLAVEGSGHDLGRNRETSAALIAMAFLEFNGQQDQRDPK